jgi:transposase-like protein
MNLKSIAKHFSDPEAAREFFERQCWPDGTVCPHCGLVGESYRLKAKPESKSPVRPGVWKCKGCRKQFTVTKGTIFEDSHIPLNVWLMTIHLLCSSKKGMSAHQIHRMLGVSYKSAWFMVHRIRYATTQDPLASQLSGIVEVDESYIGGRRRLAKRVHHVTKLGERPQDHPSPVDNKQAVVSLVQRKGEVRSHHVQRVTAANLRPILNRHIEEGARIMTDTSTTLHGAIHPRKHDQVNHSANEYGRYEDGVCISTNSVEGFFSLLKRGINGVYHHVGSQHLHRYLSEFDFRYNTRQITDGELSCRLIDKVSGKRLMYRDLVPSQPTSEV